MRAQLERALALAPGDALPVSLGADRVAVLKWSAAHSLLVLTASVQARYERAGNSWPSSGLLQVRRLTPLYVRCGDTLRLRAHKAGMVEVLCRERTRHAFNLNDNNAEPDRGDDEFPFASF